MYQKGSYDVRLPENGSVYSGKCPIVRTLDIIGGKWKLPILWHLCDRKVVRYNELRRSVRGVTNFMLTKCLRELEEDGLINRIQYDEVPPKVEYSLTERGSRLLPSLKALFTWGEEQLAIEASTRGGKTG